MTSKMVSRGKTNTQADILLWKDQVNTKENNKNIQMLKNNLWKRRQVIEVKIVIFWEHEIIKETTVVATTRHKVQYKH